MSKHDPIDIENAGPATAVEEVMAEIERQLNERDDRIAQLEGRLDNQEYSVRRVLEMLIDWLEVEDATAQSDEQRTA